MKTPPNTTILFLGTRYDYGRKEDGYSFEYFNFFHPLHRMGLDIVYFDFMSLYQTAGRDAMNRRLREVIAAEKPGLVFSLLFEDEVDAGTIRWISRETPAVMLNWFSDDHWRFDSHTSKYAPVFDWSVTTAAVALPRYAAIGCEKSVIKSQWACNHFLYRPPAPPLPLSHDVTFVGQPHGNRREIIRAIHDAGIRVECFGRGWDSGRLTQDQMIALFNTSRINLNLSNSSTAVPTTSTPLKRAIAKTADRLGLGDAARAAFRTIRGSSPPTAAGTATLDLDLPLAPEQIKGRNFEVPGCGGFLLSGRVENLGEYYDIGREAVCFDSARALIDTIRHYLAHEPDRAAIAKAGLDRTLREHTYVHRFCDIFRRIGFPAHTPDHYLAGSIKPGAVREFP